MNIPVQPLTNQVEGLSEAEVTSSRQKFGSNAPTRVRNNAWLQFIKDLFKEPMVLLLMAASLLYFLHGEKSESAFLAISIIFVFSISRYQESRSKKALISLERLTQPYTKVIRNSTTRTILTHDIVVGDIIVVEEGGSIPADAVILSSHDFSVNESILTGESFTVIKGEGGNQEVYKGTMVSSGSAVCRVISVGELTKIGTLGKTVRSISIERSPLQLQIRSLVMKMAWGGLVIFLIILVFNLLNSTDFAASLLSSLTLAMSLLPEEIPVAMSTFMALGARKLLQSGIIVKRVDTVETLGAASVICIDKTGTITRNEMRLDSIYVHATGRICTASDVKEIEDVITCSMWASEPVPFDAMEIEIHKIYETAAKEDSRKAYKLVKEYPLGGRPPFMTHIFRNDRGDTIIAAKGAPEAMIRLSVLTPDEKRSVLKILNDFSVRGFRVLAVGVGTASEPFPEQQESISFVFKGLLAFHDPPKANMKNILQSFYDAGIKVKILTGDNPETTSAIAKEIGMTHIDHSISGETVMHLSDDELAAQVRDVSIFSRMFPEAKMRVIDALKKMSEIVAMTGDGVNDGPALRSAHIGIAMGTKGSEVAKEASAIILPGDDLSKMVDAIAIGRRIHTNLKKAIRYIISIHIPIILIVFVPLLFGWIYPVIFSPVHVIFLELIMGPTCSIVFENEPIEEHIMMNKPRSLNDSLFTFSEMMMGILQGVAIGGGLFFVYLYGVNNRLTLEQLTTMVFVTLIGSNIWLMLVNRSFKYSILQTFKYRNRLVPAMILLTMLLVTAIYFIAPLQQFFHFGRISLAEWIICCVTGFASAAWIELYKAFSQKGV